MIMEDVTASIFGMLFLASMVMSELMPSSRRAKIISLLLLLAAGIITWTRISLPVSQSTADALSITSMVGWAVFIPCVARKWLREIKAASRA